MQKYDYDVNAMKDSGYGWPVIELNCRYIKPLFYNMKTRYITEVKTVITNFSFTQPKDRNKESIPINEAKNNLYPIKIINK